MKIKKQNCALCDNTTILDESHIIPSFVFRWIKNTSATGFLRSGKLPDMRKQDGIKMHLFCGKCEDIFNKYETDFSKYLFYQYVNDELSNEGIARGIVKEIEYDEWLLKFIISVQWRVMLAIYEEPVSLSDKQLKVFNELKEIWKEYLNDNRTDTGNNQSYLIFLQNIAAAEGYIPTEMNDRINYYLLRSVDMTIAFSKRDLGLYTKIGPIVLFTSLIPEATKYMSDCRVKKKGVIKTAQKLLNTRITQFIFIDRPNEVLPNMVFSDKQKEIIEKAYKKNPKRVQDSMTIRAAESDMFLKMIKESDKDK